MLALFDIRLGSPPTKTLLIGVAAGVVLGLVVFFLVPAPAFSAHGPSTHYSDSKTNCKGNRLDPVGVVFYGRRADANNSLDMLTNHAEMFLGGGAEEGKQGLFVYVSNDPRDALVCQENVDSRSTFDEVRHHARVWNSKKFAWPSPKSVGTPHKEQLCGFPHHCVLGNNETNDGSSGFDKGRRYLKRKFMAAGNHPVTTVFWGNTAGIPQRDGDVAASNGHVLRVKVGHTH